jgi:hypothetical protein
VKRSRSIKLVLIGSLTAGAMTGCGPKSVKDTPVTSDRVYTNNYYLPGAGYYHAPFRTFFSLPYNHYDATSRRYFYGGMWGPAPFLTITNISAPTPGAAAMAEAQRTDIPRAGFGSTSGHSHVYS